MRNFKPVSFKTFILQRFKIRTLILGHPIEVHRQQISVQVASPMNEIDHSN